MSEIVKGFKLEPKKLRIYGLVGSVVGIYLAAISTASPDTNMFSFMGAVAAIFGVVMGANAVRRVCAYGIGTGVPSIGMLSLGMGVVAVLFGLTIAEQLGMGLLGVIIALVYSLIFGYVVGVIANKVIGFNIPVMEEGLTDLSGAGTLAILGWCFAISGSLGLCRHLARCHQHRLHRHHLHLRRSGHLASLQRQSRPG